MTDKIEIQGKTVDAAVSEALLQMGARRDEVEIKVLEEPKGGFLGLLGGRPARVLVRKKRGRRGGGRNQDHRQDQDGYGFSGDNQSRGGRGRRGGGGRGSSQGGGRNENQDDNRRGGRGRGQRSEGQGGRQDRQDTRNDSRNDARAEGQGQNERKPDGERKSGGTRRGSRGGRGRGGRGRRQDAVAQDQNQNQNDNRGNQQRDAAPRDDRGGRQERQDRPDRSDQRNERSRRGGRGRGDQGGGRQDDNRRADSRQDSGPRDDSRRDDNRRDDNRREQQRQERSRRDTRPASAEVAPAEAPTPTPAPAAAAKSVNELHPIRRAADVKKADPSAPAPAKPGKKKTFGGLGARRKSNLEAAAQKAEFREAEARQAAETRAQDTSAMDEAAARAKAKPGEIRRKGVPEGEGGGSSAPRDPHGSRAPRRDSARREAGYPSREPGDEVIIAEVKAVSYAKPVDAPADEAALDTLKELASGMLARAGFSCDVETRPDEYSQVIITTDEENAGMLIGRHGQAVEAVEHLVERMASNAADDRVRMNLDINEYRVRRQESLLERVGEVVADVRESGQAYHMEPMDARERRLVHMGAADVEGIKTYTQIGSRGKHVVIAVDDGGDGDQNDEPVFTDEG